MRRQSPPSEPLAPALVSIGVPVFNGEKMLPAALKSLLGQTYEEIEVIICDNASTDRTREICRDFAAADRRVAFHESEDNRGAAWNFNRTFHLSSGEFFKWAAHDDLCAPRLVEECVKVLTEDPELIVLCHCQSDEIDPSGAFLRKLHCLTGIGGSRPSQRFEAVVLERHASIPIFGDDSGKDPEADSSHCGVCRIRLGPPVRAGSSGATSRSPRGPFLED